MKRIGTTLSGYFHFFSLSRFLIIENIFATIFLVGGVVFIIITPPGQNPDESAHFERAVQLANFNLFPESKTTNGQQLTGGQIPASVNRFFSDYDISYKFDTSHKFNRTNSADAQSLPLNTTEEFVDFRGSATYSPLGYVSIIPSIWVGKLLNLSLFSTFYLARIFSLLTVLVLLYLSIKIIPIGKWMLFCVDLLPSTIAQSAAVSADGITIGMSILFISYVLHLAIQQKQLTWIRLFILALLIAVLGLVKIAYLPLVALLLLVPLFHKRTRNWRSIVTLVVIIILSALPAIFWLHATSNVNSAYSVLFDVNRQESFILHQPLSYLHILYDNFFTETNPAITPVVWVGVFGNFGYLTAPLPTFAVYITLFCMTCSLFLISPREHRWNYGLQTSRMYRTMIFGTLIVSCALIATALYLYSSPVRSTLVEGIQGRYFIPVIPLLLLAFYGNSLRHQKIIKVWLPIIYSLIITIGLMTAYHRYY